jgi:hypothetical protein
MRRAECPHEGSVLESVQTGQWPDHCRDELRQHVACCPLCRDLVDTAGPILDAGRDARLEATVPSADLVWWRAQFRARRDAACEAARPVALAHAASLALATVTALGLLVWSWPWLATSAASVIRELPVLERELAPLGPTLAGFTSRTLVIVLAAWLLLAPVAIYIALSDD